MLKIVAPALAVMAAIYLMKKSKKGHEANEDERIDDAFEAGAYPAE
jgi:hypothetical protein